jgi:hypothetical protein
MCQIKHITPENETTARNFEIRKFKFSAEKRSLIYAENVTFFSEWYLSLGPQTENLFSEQTQSPRPEISDS